MEATFNIKRFFEINSRKIKSIQQSENSDCGVTCLAMILNYWGHKIDLSTLKSKVETSNKGMTLSQLIDISKRFQLDCRALKFPIDSVGDLNLPCIVHLKRGHFVVLTRVTNKKVYIVDPSDGEMTYFHSEFESLISGVALELFPSISFEPKNEYNSIGFAYFSREINLLKSTGVALFIFSLFFQIVMVGLPILSQKIIDHVLNESIFAPSTYFYISAGAILLSTSVQYIRALFAIYLSSRFSVLMGSKLIDELMRLKYEYFSSRSSGEISSRFHSVQNIKETLSNELITALLDGILLIVVLAALYIYEPSAAYISMIAGGLYLSVKRFFFQIKKDGTQLSMAAHAQKDSVLYETLLSIQTIKLHKKESERAVLWNEKLQRAESKEVKINKLNSIEHAFSNIINQSAYFFVIYILILAIASKELSVGELFAIVSLSTIFTSGIQNLVDKFTLFRLQSVHFQRLGDIVFAEKDSVLDDKTKLNDDWSEIEVRGLSYRFPGDDVPVFQDVSFKLEKGQSLAIIGPSGYGKSTLLKCLCGLLTPCSGDILIDGKIVNNCQSYRDRISAVLQGDYLLPGTVLYNIAGFSEKHDFNKVLYSSELACIKKDIEQMPMGFNSLIGGLGAVFSAGQIQRIQLARALYHEPQILLLDEATSHLDITTEKSVMNNIASLKPTKIMVAHRPQAISTADFVLNMPTGEVTAQNVSKN